MVEGVQQGPVLVGPFFNEQPQLSGTVGDSCCIPQTGDEARQQDFGSFIAVRWHGR